jgi:hypothetical protein
MRRPWSLGLVLLASGCATYSPLAAQVSVYRQPVNDFSSAAPMPAGCRSVSAKPVVPMTELEMIGDKQAFRRQREEAATSGANTLLVRTHLVHPRGFNCPVASPITDCPGTSGAWYDVVFEGYACDAEALEKLATPPATAARPAGTSD